MVILPEGGIVGQNWVESPHPDSGNLIMFDALALASLARVDSPVRKGFAQRTQRLGKGITELSLDHPGWRACGVAGVTGLSEPGYNGGGWRGGVSVGGAIKDQGR